MTDTKLKSIVDRIERLEEEQRALGGDKRDIYVEAKSAGYNPKALRKVIAQRKQKDQAEVEADMDAYRHALGMASFAVQLGELSIRKAAKKYGVSKSAVQRTVPREEKPAIGTPHDPATGEVIETQDAAPRTCVDGSPAASAGPAVPRFATPQAGDPVTPVPDGGVGAGTLPEVPPVETHTEGATPNAGLSVATPDVDWDAVNATMPGRLRRGSSFSQERKAPYERERAAT